MRPVGNVQFMTGTDMTLRDTTSYIFLYSIFRNLHHISVQTVVYRVLRLCLSRPFLLILTDLR